jgi:hypothetical protein
VIRSAGRATLIAVVVIAGVSGCVSKHRSITFAGTGSGPTAGPSVSTTTRVSAPATTAAQHLPTVSNCGGGAYEPKTLLIVCGSGTTIATGVSWQAWGTSTASGSGTVQLAVHGHTTAAPAALRLSEVVNGPVGPQFSRLTVTWTGASPDGKPQEVYSLQIQG